MEVGFAQKTQTAALTVGMETDALDRIAVLKTAELVVWGDHFGSHG
jgi:hypothetical protein